MHPNEWDQRMEGPLLNLIQFDLTLRLEIVTLSYLYQS